MRAKQNMRTNQKPKKPVAFKFDLDVISALDAEAQRTGKSKTAVVEDAVLLRRQFSDEAEAAIQWLAVAHKLPTRKVVEMCVLKAAGIGRDLPFDGLAAA